MFGAFCCLFSDDFLYGLTLEQNVYHCASIAANDIEGVPAANAFAIEDGILIGKLSVESQLLVETHKLSEPPREIVFDPEHSLYYVLTEVDDSADSYSTSLLAIDAQSLKRMVQIRLCSTNGMDMLSRHTVNSLLRYDADYEKYRSIECSIRQRIWFWTCDQSRPYRCWLRDYQVRRETSIEQSQCIQVRRRAVRVCA